MAGYLRYLQGQRGELGKGQVGIGELVKMRSGGRVMVVQEVDEVGLVHCIWQDKAGKIEERAFGAELLRRAKENIWRRYFG